MRLLLTTAAIWAALALHLLLLPQTHAGRDDHEDEVAMAAHPDVAVLRGAKINPELVLDELQSRNRGAIPPEWGTLEATVWPLIVAAPGGPAMGANAAAISQHYHPICWALVRRPDKTHRVVRAGYYNRSLWIDLCSIGTPTSPPQALGKRQIFTVEDEYREDAVFLPGRFASPPNDTFDIRFRVGDRMGHFRAHIDDNDEVTFERHEFPDADERRNQNRRVLLELIPDAFAIAHVEAPPEPTRKLKLDTDEVTDVAVRPDGSVVTLGLRELGVWDPTTGKKLSTIKTGPPPQPFGDLPRHFRMGMQRAVMECSPDLSLIAPLDGDLGDTTVVELSTGRLITAPGHFAFHPQFLNDHVMAGRQNNGELGTWDLTTGQTAVINFNGPTDFANMCGVGAGLCAWNDIGSRRVMVFDPSKRKPLAKIPTATHNECGISLSPDGKLVAINADPISIHSLAKGELIWRHPSFRDLGERRVRWNRDGSMATLTAEDYAYAWDTSPPTFIARFPLPRVKAEDERGNEGDAALAPDGTTLAVIRAGVDTVWIWDLKKIAAAATQPSR